MVVAGRIVNVVYTKDVVKKYGDILPSILGVTEILIRIYPYDKFIFKENNDFIEVSIDGNHLYDGIYSNEVIARYPNTINFKDSLLFELKSLEDRYVGTYSL